MDELVAGFKHQDKFPLSEAKTDNSYNIAQDTPAMNFLVEGNQYILDCISDIDAIGDLGPEWKSLERNHCEPYSYFQSYDWCYQWCKIYGQQIDGNSAQDIKIYVLRRNGELIMVWPMMIAKSRAGIRNLTFLTEPHGQYGNVILNRRLFSTDVGKRVWNHIRTQTKADAITLDQYPKSSMLCGIVDGQGYVENSRKYSSVLSLTAFETWDDYRASLPRKLRKQRNQRHNKLAKQGNVDYEVHYGGSEKYRELVDLALRWKVEWLSATGRRATVLSMDTTKTFLSNLNGNQDTIPNGVVLGALTLDGKPIGIEIGMCLAGHYYSFLGAFDWQHRKLSPGKMQIEFAQKWAKEAGLEKFDFLGDPADYKSTWTDSKTELESQSFPITVRGYFYCVVWKAYLRPLARATFNKMNANNRAKLLQMLGIGEKGVSKKPGSENTNSETCAANK